MAVSVNGTEITLTGNVGDYWASECFTHADVVGALAMVGRETDITVHLNSGGGISTEGAAIHAALAAHKGRVEMVVEGWAASAASLIAMAGDVVKMAKGAVMMIHDPSGGVWGTAKDMRKGGEALDVLADAYAGVYADKCGKKASEVRKIMVEETWFRPEEAVAAGFADEVLPDEDPHEPMAFSGITAYSRVPDNIVALAKSRGWDSRAFMAALPAATRREEDHSMTDKPEAGKESPATTSLEHPTAAAPVAPVESAAPVEATAVAEACHKAGFAVLTASLLKVKDLTMAMVDARIAEAKEITETATKVGVPSMATKLISAGVSVETARELIFDAKASIDEASPSDTVHRDPATADAGNERAWDTAITKANAIAGFGH